MDDWQNLTAELAAMERAATATLAAYIGKDGVDACQPAAYDLAFAAAEIAAFGALAHSDTMADPVMRDLLAGVFAAQILPGTVMRCDRVTAACGSDAAPFAASPLYGRLLSAAAPDAGARIVAGGTAYREISTSEESDMARSSFWRFGQDVVAPLAERIHREDLTVPETILAPLREMGAFGLSIPERFGGLAPDDGEDSAAMLAITEALSAASLGAAGSLITRPEILARAVLAGGTEAQKAHWLPRIAVGDPLCAISITEPDYGSDVASLALKARKVAGGWTLSGAKTWCTFAGKAGLLMVVARTDDTPGHTPRHRGLSLFLVEKPPTDAHEFTVTQPTGGTMTGKAIPTIGYRGMHSFNMAYDDFFVPDANLIGGEEGRGRGFYLTMAGMVGGRMQTAARACGLMMAAIDAASAYAEDRKVFGVPLAQHGLVQDRIAGMAAKLAACRALAYRTGALVDRGDDGSSDGAGRMEASLAKLIACRCAEEVTRDALQLFGGMGYAEETSVSRYFVDARVLSIFEGAEETLALKVIARELLARAEA
ncbi:(2S)-methylsuccinyl-CoA dehydrogenase [Alteripontixanthobacter maritimus]|uniref:(2S)-methylsuccinyl-CoA dehydrogenase n=1 Tax=Alteripontixanthobacter maritimus TaxID=2161824 RepID=A0A369Q3B1_9SPHN|nr:acyl-CoA dehydrogenase family protein [Alteripontixanthobacter maritimus]RDC58950.1 (2S)-methylsuccinyl-CoA dehydrogenase [Alteripontixanthobacter maritimus]